MTSIERSSDKRAGLANFSWNPCQLNTKVIGQLLNLEDGWKTLI
jgi:hypothetical protein